MNKIKLLASLSTLIALYSSCASATALPIGWYLEGNLGKTHMENMSYGPNTTASENGLGWNINLGYKFIPNFAAELGYTHYADASAKFNGTKVANDSHYSVDVAGKGVMPIYDSGIALFAKLGIARTHSHVSATNTDYINANSLSIYTGSHSATSYYLGLGADYAFMPNFLANLQWQRANGSSHTGRLDLYSIGFSYIFS